MQFYTFRCAKLEPFHSCFAVDIVIVTIETKHFPSEEIGCNAKDVNNLKGHKLAQHEGCLEFL
jgi:hypothetical protein